MVTAAPILGLGVRKPNWVKVRRLKGQRSGSLQDYIFLLFSFVLHAHRVTVLFPFLFFMKQKLFFQPDSFLSVMPPVQKTCSLLAAAPLNEASVFFFGRWIASDWIDNIICITSYHRLMKRVPDRGKKMHFIFVNTRTLPLLQHDSHNGAGIIIVF